jgi:hypothetical protein
VLILAILFIQLSQPNLSLELNLILLDLLFYQQSLHAVMDKRAARYKSGDGNEYKGRSLQSRTRGRSGHI